MAGSGWLPVGVIEAFGAKEDTVDAGEQGAKALQPARTIGDEVERPPVRSERWNGGSHRSQWRRWCCRGERG
jgi:hypothetical protein